MDMAPLAAKIDAEAWKPGRTIPLADLAIGATALHFGYAVGTRRRARIICNAAVMCEV
jgi:predicted nucleic acid-binding protein